MDKSKIFPVIFLIIILGIGFVAFTFYSEKQKLAIDNEKIKEERAALVKENGSLQYKYRKIEKEKTALEQKVFKIQEDLSQLEREKDELEGKLTGLSQERDSLAEKIKQVQATAIPVAATVSAQESLPEEHWADFVKNKATLEAKVGLLTERLGELTEKTVRLEKDNKELTFEINQLTREKERISEETEFDKRTLKVMSMDLVNEREKRNSAARELKELQRENAKLKRGLILANKEKIDLQNNLKEMMGRKESFENRIESAEKVLKEKSLALAELREELRGVVDGDQESLAASESASVELPPIVVKPSVVPGIRELRGEIIAVNPVDKFVVINLGDSSNLKIGDLLKVVRDSKEVGTVEVIEIRKEISAADIISVQDGLFIKEGDTAVIR